MNGDNGKTDPKPKNVLDWLGISEAPDWAKARWLGAGVGALIFLLFGLALVALFGVLGQTIVQAFSPGTEGPNLGAGALIAALLGAPFVIWGTWLKHQTVRYQKEGHITDRINKAVEMLGAEKTVKKLKKDKSGSVEVTVPNIEVRIGAILSLERIAQDSTIHDKGRDHVRVMEILCAYIRENAPANEAKDHQFGEWVPLKLDADLTERAEHLEKCEVRFGKSLDDSVVSGWAKTLPVPREDISQVLAVIGRRNIDQLLVKAKWGGNSATDAKWVFSDLPPPRPRGRQGGPISIDKLGTYTLARKNWRKLIVDYQGYRLDLQNTNLQRAHLANATLSGAKLLGARLDGADLTKAQISGADLREARLEGAILREARIDLSDLRLSKMEGADLSNSSISASNLQFVRIEAANFSGARMDGVDLFRASAEKSAFQNTYLLRADFNDSRMVGASFSGAFMELSDLCNAQLDGVDLRNAWLEGADFGGASIKFANLNAAWLQRARFPGVHLHGADLRNANMKEANFIDAVCESAVLGSAKSSDAPFSNEQFNSMFGDSSVALPDGIARPAHWLGWRMYSSEFETEWRKWQADPKSYAPPPKP